MATLLHCSRGTHLAAVTEAGAPSIRGQRATAAVAAAPEKGAPQQRAVTIREQEWAKITKAVAARKTAAPLEACKDRSAARGMQRPQRR